MLGNESKLLEAVLKSSTVDEFKDNILKLSTSNVDEVIRSGISSRNREIIENRAVTSNSMSLNKLFSDTIQKSIKNVLIAASKEKLDELGKQITQFTQTVQGNPEWREITDPLIGALKTAVSEVLDLSSSPNRNALNGMSSDLKTEIQRRKMEKEAEKQAVKETKALVNSRMTLTSGSQYQEMIKLLGVLKVYGDERKGKNSDLAKYKRGLTEKWKEGLERFEKDAVEKGKFDFNHKDFILFQKDIENYSIRHKFGLHENVALQLISSKPAEGRRVVIDPALELLKSFQPLIKEAEAKAEAEAREKVEQEAKAKAEAEVREKAEKAEQEAKAKAEAEAREKAEKAEQEAKAKAEAREKAEKAEQEAKAQETISAETQPKEAGSKLKPEVVKPESAGPKTVENKSQPKAASPAKMDSKIKKKVKSREISLDDKPQPKAVNSAQMDLTVENKAEPRVTSVESVEEKLIKERREKLLNSEGYKALGELITSIESYSKNSFRANGLLRSLKTLQEEVKMTGNFDPRSKSFEAVRESVRVLTSGIIDRGLKAIIVPTVNFIKDRHSEAEIKEARESKAREAEEEVKQWKEKGRFQTPYYKMEKESFQNSERNQELETLIRTIKAYANSSGISDHAKAVAEDLLEKFKAFQMASLEAKKFDVKHPLFIELDKLMKNRGDGQDDNLGIVQGVLLELDTQRSRRGFVSQVGVIVTSRMTEFIIHCKADAQAQAQAQAQGKVNLQAIETREEALYVNPLDSEALTGARGKAEQEAKAKAEAREKAEQEAKAKAEARKKAEAKEGLYPNPLSSNTVILPVHLRAACSSAGVQEQSKQSWSARLMAALSAIFSCRTSQKVQTTEEQATDSSISSRGDSKGGSVSIGGDSPGSSVASELGDSSYVESVAQRRSSSPGCD